MKVIKKAFSYIVSALAVLIFSGFLSLRPVGGEPVFAYHEGSDACVEITAPELTRPVPSPADAGRLSGVNDSGQLDFSLPESHLYKACVRTDESPPASSLHPVQGWTWNTNLGWMSFSCDAATGLNLDGSCGGQTYGATFNESGDVRNFAYGDNIGYVSLGCDSGDNNGVACGGTNYGVQVALTNGTGAGSCGTVNRGDLYGYAWSDSFGWVNFCGAHVDIDEVLSGGAGGYSTILSFVPHGSGSTGEVYANGVDSHEVQLQILRGGTAIDPGAEGLSIGLSGGVLIDTVRIDQINNTGSGAVTQNVFSMGGYRWNPSSMSFVSPITSIAPTDGETNSFSISEFPLISIGGVSVQATGAPHSFTFAPPVTVTGIQSPDVASGMYRSGEITTVANNTQIIRVIAAANADLSQMSDINIATQIFDCVDDQYSFSVQSRTGATESTASQRALASLLNINNTAFTGVCPGTAPDSVNHVSGVDVQSFVSGAFPLNVNINTVQDTSGQTASFGSPLGAQTVVSYSINGRQVQYFSLAQEGGGVNQLPDIRGNVRVDIVESSTGGAGSITQSLGANATSKREPFYRAVKKTIGAGQQSALRFSPSSGTVVLDAADFNPGNGNVARGIFFFNKRNLDAPGASSCSVIIRGGDDISFAGFSTIVTEGCNIFFDKNVRSAGRLAVISLEDRSVAQSNGNVYVCNLVTDLEANIIADGSVFSYGNNMTDCGGDDKSTMTNDDGTPNFGFDFPARELLKHQLAIVGSIISNNTIGGSQIPPPDGPLMCDGSRAAAGEATMARLCDINFLRYAKIRPRPNNPGENCWAIDTVNNVRLSKRWTPSGFSDDASCTRGTNFPNIGGGSGGHGVVNIIFRAPANQQPVFNAVKTK